MHGPAFRGLPLLYTFCFCPGGRPSVLPHCDLHSLKAERSVSVTNRAHKSSASLLCTRKTSLAQHVWVAHLPGWELLLLPTARRTSLLPRHRQMQPDLIPAGKCSAFQPYALSCFLFAACAIFQSWQQAAASFCPAVTHDKGCVELHLCGTH